MRLRPWQAAAAVTGVLLVVQALVLVVPVGRAGGGGEAAGPLSPRSAEIATMLSLPVICFAVLWLTFLVVARVRRRRDEARTP